jgi:threonyl-tRNA synthetase
MVVIGDKEVETNMLSIRHRRLGDLGTMPVDQFISQVKDETARRVLDNLENKIGETKN